MDNVVNNDLLYIDNNLLRASSKGEAHLQTDLVTKVLEAPGCVISHWN